METAYCAYPPRIASDVELQEQRDGARTAYVRGSAAAGRYVLLHQAEYEVFRLLRRSLTPSGICDEFKREHGRAFSLGSLTKFLTKMDDVGILEGAGRLVAMDPSMSSRFYLRFNVF